MKDFPNAEPHILVPRCRAAVGSRQCRMEATKAYKYCGTHWNVIKKGKTTEELLAIMAKD